MKNVLKGTALAACLHCASTVPFDFAEVRRNWDHTITCPNCQSEFYAEQGMQKFVADGLEAWGRKVQLLIPHVRSGRA